jgi:hypothetical protein
LNCLIESYAYGYKRVFHRRHFSLFAACRLESYKETVTDLCEEANFSFAINSTNESVKGIHVGNVIRYGGMLSGGMIENVE